MTTKPLRAGDHGADVTVLQQRLNRAGQSIAIDGWYGPATETAVRAFQRSRHLVEDGIAGPRMQDALLGTVDPRALRQADIEHAAAELGCESAAINAVVEVESPRTGYLPDGRVVILFERHVFWRQLQAYGIDPVSVNAPASILSQVRGGYVGGAAEYARLAQAMAIASEPAMEACSWGRFQVMGYHAKVLGYTNATQMAAAFAKGEAEQLQAFMQFVQSDAELLKALRGRKWTAFARSYNGPAYADNLYDVKLAKAYARHAAARPPVSEVA
ncbi:N-acetylmuramidase family protein [Dyella sp.]|uniref:N-acetylmuramidase family protein n=1 Tax=Dyella sp. TaxID=1869338 RepID=UPI002B4A338F|nr:N-acetylmuramidase family protein [Dyella sp.]HKT28750.1 N-acetylmuramidase family protein [Dyella sp.]